MHCLNKFFYVFLILNIAAGSVGKTVELPRAYGQPSLYAAGREDADTAESPCLTWQTAAEKRIPTTDPEAVGRFLKRKEKQLVSL